MKKSHVFLLSIVVFMLLFYKQAVGLNLFLFNAVLLVLTYVFVPRARESRNVWLLTVGALLTAASAAWYADGSSIFLNILTWVLLPVFLHQKSATILLAESLGVWNFISAPVRLVLDRKSDKQDNSQNLLMKRILLYGVLPFVVFVLFFYLYRQINPVWGDYMWKMIGYLFSWTFVFLLLLAIVLMYAFWYFVKPTKLSHWVQRRNELAPTSQPTFKSIPLHMEMWSGVLLFGLLNLLLFSLLATDFQQLLIENKIPEGYTLSKYLHKGVYAVILSIVFAIGLLVFYFKGAFNYYKQGKLLRVLAWVWIVFNVILVLFTFYKNILYVQAYDLTFKRVSVFIYLSLCWVGLYFTAVKLRLRKTFVYIVRKMYWAFYLMWVLTTPINWTNWITAYNLEHAKQKNYKGESIDINYLTNTYQLNELNIGALYRFIKENPENPYMEELKKGLDMKYLQVVKSERKRKWRGIRLYDKYVKNYLAKQDYKPYYAEISDAIYYEELAEVKDLAYEFGYNKSKKQNDSIIAALLQYQKVERLELRGESNSYANSLKFLEPLKNLKTLDLQKFDIANNFKIEGLTQLEKLYLFETSDNEVEIHSVYPKMELFAISGSQLKNILGWEKLPALKKLQINTNDMTYLDISLLQNLQELRLHTRGLKKLKMADKLPQMNAFYAFGNENLNEISELPTMPNLTNLTIAYCNLKNLKGLAKMPKLEALNVKGNSLESIAEVASLQNLTDLHLADNKITNISPLQNLPLLENLYLMGNLIQDIAPLYTLPQLRKLSVEDATSSLLDTNSLPKELKILTDEESGTEEAVKESAEWEKEKF